MKKEIFKINDQTFITSFHNFMKVTQNYKINENAFIKNSENDSFPYKILNIDVAYELLYKHENNWYLLKYQSFDSNLATRCQQSEYKEYKIELGKKKNHLILTLNTKNKFEHIYEEHIDDYDNVAEQFEQYIPGKSTMNFIDDKILNLLLCDGWPYYNYNYIDNNKNNGLIDNKLDVEMLDVEIIKNQYSRQNLIVSYQNKTYYYSEILMPFSYSTNNINCCVMMMGGGDNTFVLLENEEDMLKFDEFFEEKNRNDIKNKIKNKPQIISL
jgi:hypothetical protein